MPYMHAASGLPLGGLALQRASFGSGQEGEDGESSDQQNNSSIAGINRSKALAR